MDTPSEPLTFWLCRPFWGWESLLAWSVSIRLL